jgi:hypothetical protein
MEPFKGNWIPVQVEVIGQRQTLPKGGGRKVTGPRASNFDSGADECTIKTSLTHASPADLAGLGFFPVHMFNVSPTAKALQLHQCG